MTLSHTAGFGVLEMTKAHPSLCRFVKCSMQLWKTDLTVNGNDLSTINIRCGIFQGDTFSPLLFILSLIPLSSLLRDTSIGSKLTSGYVINHLLYMDDLKFYAKSEEGIQSLVNTVNIFSSDIGMSFGIAKCAHLGIHRGSIKSLEGTILQIGDCMTSLRHGETYKYLGVLENRGIHHN